MVQCGWKRDNRHPRCLRGTYSGRERGERDKKKSAGTFFFSSPLPRLDSPGFLRMDTCQSLIQNIRWAFDQTYKINQDFFLLPSLLVSTCMSSNIYLLCWRPFFRMLKMLLSCLQTVWRETRFIFVHAIKTFLFLFTSFFLLHYVSNVFLFLICYFSSLDAKDIYRKQFD